MGITTAVNKTKGTSTQLVCLGTLINSHTFKLCIPAEKLAQLQLLIRSWLGKQSSTRKELEQNCNICNRTVKSMAGISRTLLGFLSHVTTIISQGRPFPWELFPCTNCRKHPSTTFTSMQVQELTFTDGRHSFRHGMANPPSWYQLLSLKSLLMHLVHMAVMLFLIPGSSWNGQRAGIRFTL